MKKKTMSISPIIPEKNPEIEVMGGETKNITEN